jgi:hypothetical protein
MSGSIAPTKGSVLATAYELVEFIQNIAIDPYDGTNRRSEPRYPIAIPVRAEPVDNNGKRFGQTVPGVTRDVSLTGISILLTRQTRAKHLLLELANGSHKPVHAILDVLRERPIGPLWEVAGQFLFESET